MITLKNCPVCGSEQIQQQMSCKDHLVSGKDFSIGVCMICQFRFTSPRPDDNDLGDYYKSDNYISHTNTKKGLASRLYHLVRKRTLKQKVRLLSRYVSRGTLLDYGAGTGMFLDAAKAYGFNAVGIEPDPTARLHARELGLELLADKNLLQSSQRFDVVTAWHVLEHVSDLNETIEHLKAHLVEKGVFVIALPNYRSFDANYYGPNWAAYDVPRHLYHFDKVSIRNLMAKHQFQLTATHPMVFDSYYVAMLSEKYKTGKNNYLKALWVGFLSNFRAGNATGYSSVIYVFRKL